MLTLVKPKITKATTNMRQPIPAEERLAVTLRYLATGETYESLMYQYRIHSTTIAKIVPEVCQAIYEKLKDNYCKIPSTSEEWLEISNRTYERWNFPNSFAAVDGKHVAILHPKRSGSDFYNYKGYFSIVLLAFVDYDYCFLMVDVGCQGRISDGGVLKHSAIYPAIKNNTLNLPEPQMLPIPEDYPLLEPQEKIPFVFVADDAFQLEHFCMKPYSLKNLTDDKRIFNYRLSRFRRVTENAFGIWVNRFRIFTVRNNLNEDNAQSAILATVALHNMLRKQSARFYTPQGFCDTVDMVTGEITEGAWRSEAHNNNTLLDISRTSSRHASQRVLVIHGTVG